MGSCLVANGLLWVAVVGHHLVTQLTGSATSSASPNSALISRIARRPRGCSEGHGRRPGAASLSSARAQRGGSNASTAPSTAFCVEPTASSTATETTDETSLAVATASSTATDTTDDTSLAVAWIVACG